MSWIRDEPRMVWSWQESDQVRAETSDEMLHRAGRDGSLRLVAIQSGLSPVFTTPELWALLQAGQREFV